MLGKSQSSYKRMTVEKVFLPFRALVHPLDTYEEMKYKKNGSYRVGFILLLLWLLSEVLVRKNKGFVFNNINPDMVNIFDIISGTLAVFVLLTVSNYLLCIFMEGEGTYKQIFSCFSYGTLLITFFNTGVIILTGILSIEMISFFVLYNWIFYVWGAVYVICGIMSVHQFSLKKSLLNIFLTVVGFAVMAGVLFLLYSLYQQVASFFYTIYNEILFRI